MSYLFRRSNTFEIFTSDRASESFLASSISLFKFSYATRIRGFDETITQGSAFYFNFATTVASSTSSLRIVYWYYRKLRYDYLRQTT
jgi:hypothetical protein